MLLRLRAQTARNQPRSVSVLARRFQNTPVLSTTRSPLVPSLFVAFMVGTGAAYCSSSSRADAEVTEPQTIFDFEATRIDGTPESLSKYRGKVCLIVNVASK